MNPELKQHILNSLNKGLRLDGRKLDEIRPITIKTGIVSTAEGSARVKFGDAEVLAGLKMAVETPYPDTPEHGILMVNSELLPLSSPEFESGPPSIDSIETSRVIDRGIRESKAVDTKSLCIAKGEKVWSMAIDVVPINFDGGLLDMGGVAAMAAMLDARFPSYTEEYGVDYHKKTTKKIDIKHIPIPITVCKIGNYLIVDPTQEEERAIDARLTVTFLDSGKICAMQKGGDLPFKQEELNTIVELAHKKSQEVRKALMEALK